MKRTLFHAILFVGLCLLFAPGAAHAQTAYGYSEVGYNSAARYVYGYSATWTDYEAAWYYDPEVHAMLFRLPEVEIPLDQGRDVGFSDPANGYQIAAEVYNESGAYSDNTTYEEYSTHFVKQYYSYSYCFDCWYDPYGFSMWGNSFMGTGSYNYGWPSYFYNTGYYVNGRSQVFGRIAVRIKTPAPQCSAGYHFDAPSNTCVVTPTPTPPQQCTPATLNIGDRTGETITGQAPKALPGATVELTADTDSTNLGAGTHTWEFTDLQNKTNSGESTMSDQVEVVWKEAGDKTVKVTFKPNSNTSCSYSATTTVKVQFPTVTSFTGQQQATRVVNKGGTQCYAENGQVIPAPNFGVGCWPAGRAPNASEVGIVFDAKVDAPEGYISRPSESQVRWVQRVNVYYKGTFACGDRFIKLRSSLADLTTGWMLDTRDPYGALAPSTFTDDSSTIEMPLANDSPVLEILAGQTALESDTRFEMHLVYAGITSAGKQVEKSLGFVPWKIPGKVTLNAATQTYTLDPNSVEPAGTKQATIKVGDLSYVPFRDIPYTACPSTGPTTLPAPKTSNDIGAVGLEGSAGYESGTYTLAGSGTDIWDGEDSFQFVHETLTGDGDMVARVGSLDYTNEWAKAGVMIRENLAGNSRHASMFVTPAMGTAFQWRTDPGLGSNHVGYGGAPPAWVKISRRGNTFTGYTSADGANWAYVGSATFYMPPTVYFGLALTSHNNGLLCRATFDNVSVTPYTFSCDPYQEENCYNQGGDWDSLNCRCYLPQPDPCLRKSWYCDGGPYTY